MSRKNKGNKSNGGVTVHKPKTFGEFQKLDRSLRDRGYIALDALRPGLVRSPRTALDFDSGTMYIAPTDNTKTTK